MDKKEFYSDLPVITTRRLTLRAMTLDDLDDVHAYASDDEVTRYLRWSSHPDKDHTRAYILGVLDEYAAGSDGPWVIEMTDEGRVAGAIHVIRFDRVHQVTEIGYCLNRAWWKKGIMTEALKAVMHYCFKTLGFHRVQCMCWKDNRASARVMEKAGMKYEGTLRGYHLVKGKHRDMKVYAKIR